MSRAALTYGDRHAIAPAEGHSPDEPVEGYYRLRLRSGGHPVGVRIWFGRPKEPWTGEIMDRAPCWNAEINGKWSELSRVWPRCAASKISKADHDHLLKLHRWGVENAPDGPQANPHKKVDLLKAPLPF